MGDEYEVCRFRMGNGRPDPVFPWSETKRAANIKAHGLDFLDAASVFEGMTFTFEDDRFSYGEQRFVTLGLLAGITVSATRMDGD